MAHLFLHAGDRVFDGFASTSIFRKARRQACAAGNGPAGLRHGGVVFRNAGELPVASADGRDTRLPGVPAAWLAVLPRTSAEGCSRNGAGNRYRISVRTTRPRPGPPCAPELISGLCKRMTGHQFVGMFPAWQSPHAFEPGPDRRVIFGDIESKFLGRVVQVAS